MEYNDLFNIDIFQELDALSSMLHSPGCGFSHQISQKLKAAQTENESHKIFYVTDSHVPDLRNKAAMRYDRLLINENNQDVRNQLCLFKNILVSKCHSDIGECTMELAKQVAEMPKEWTIVQLTLQFNPMEFQNIDANVETNGLYLSVFNCGQNELEPFLVDLNSPSLAGNNLSILQNFMTTLKENVQRLANTGKRKYYASHKEKYEYFLKTEEINLKLMSLVKNVEENWLKEWRCLLIGKYKDNKIEKLIKKELKTIIEKYLKDVNMSQKSFQLLYYLIKGVSFLNNEELLKAVCSSLNGNVDLKIVKEIAQAIREVNIKINSMDALLLRHPVILIIDEVLDMIPWEALDILKDQPVSRIPSLHFVYFLFKAHENEIKEGHKIVKNYENGKYIVNPDRDLQQMETRMMTFFKYWLSTWNGISDRKPTHDEFYDLLQKSDIFCYSGHGNGAHIMRADTLQKINVKAVVLLFGCASTGISKLGPQISAYGSYHMYLISRCPCVLGMLWPVTDIYTDILTTDFLSSWLPSTAIIPWAQVDKTQWKKAVNCDLVAVAENAKGKIFNNLELLGALNIAKGKMDNFLIKAACVVRGLPVKIELQQ